MIILLLLYNDSERRRQSATLNNRSSSAVNLGFICEGAGEDTRYLIILVKTVILYFCFWLT